MRRLPVAQLLSQALPRVQPRAVRSHHLSAQRLPLLLPVEPWLRHRRLLLRVGLLHPLSLLSHG